MIKKSLHTFSGGMDRDTSKSKMGNTKYYDAWNLQLITQGGLSSFAFENKKGHKLNFSLPLTVPAGTWGDGVSIPEQTSLVILGFGSMREYLIVFTASKTSGGSYGTYNQIWRISYDLSTHIPIDTSGSPNYTLSSTKVNAGGNLLYNGALEIPITAKVKVVKERYINSNYGKIYWITGVNPLRHFNILDVAHDAVPLSNIDILANVNLVKIKNVTVINSGNYKAGMVQYSYNLFNLYGNESAYAPASGFIHLVASSETLATSTEYRGSPAGTNVGKSIQGTIDNIDTNFEYIRIVAIHYDNIQGTPLIGVVGEFPISSSGTINFIDSGVYQDEISYQEFLSIGSANLNPGTLESKDNRLVAANINNDIFDVDIDARAYRFRGASDSTPALQRQSLLYNYGDTTFVTPVKQIDGTAGTISWPDNIVNSEKELDCYNEFNYYPNDNIAVPTDRCMYQSDGETLGGDGPIVSYKFGVISSLIDNNLLPDSSSAIDVSSDSLGVDRGIQNWQTILGNDFVNNTTYKNSASVINHRQLVGYQRNEVYRCGIVFRSKKGIQSYVKWIADIRTPKHTDTTNAYTFGRDTRSLQIIDPGGAGDTVQVQIAIGGSTYSKLYTVVLGDTVDTIAAGLKALIIADATLSAQLYSVDAFTSPAGVLRILGKEKTHFSFSFSLGGAGGINATLYSSDPVYWTDVHTDFANTWIDYPKWFYSYPTYANILYIDFTIDLSKIPADIRDDIDGYEIVRVERSAQDRNVLMQGLLECTMLNSASSEPNIVEPDFFCSDFLTYLYQVAPSTHPRYSAGAGGTGKVMKTIFQMHSPELLFNRSYEYQTGDYVELCGMLTPFCKYRSIGSGTISGFGAVLGNYKQITANQVAIINSMEMISYPGPAMPMVFSDCYIPITGGKIYGLTSNPISIEDGEGVVRQFRAYCQDDINPGGLIQSSRRGTALVFTTADAGVATTYIKDTNWNTGVYGYHRMAVNYIRFKPAIYGGSSYADRGLNTYISTNSYRPITSFAAPVTSSVFGGDVYIEPFDYLRKMRDTYYNYQQELVYSAVESTVCLPLRHDNCYHRNKINTIQETQLLGDQAIAAGVFSGTYTLGDLYLYNSVYSKENNTNKYFPKALLQLDIIQDDCLIWASEEASIYDVTDKWLSFLPTNIKRCEAAYGPINRLIIFKDLVLYFQTYGYGIVPINERSYSPDSQGTAVVLGKGDVLGKLKYLSTTVGCTHHDGIITTDSFLYFFDSVNKKIYIHTGDVTPLTDLKGTHELLLALNGNINKEDKIYSGGSGITTFWDKQNNQVLFCIRDTSTNGDYILVYNELLKGFEFRLPTAPKFIYNHRGISLIHNNNSTGGLPLIFEINAGNYGTFYGNTPVDSSLTLLMADEEDLVKLLTNLEWHTEVYSGTIDQPTSTITRVRVWNEYQDTGIVTLTPDSNLIRLMRTWRHSVELNTSSGNDDDRMRGQSFFITLYFSNANNYRLVLHDLKTYYIPSEY